MSTLWQIYHKHWTSDTQELLVRSVNSGRVAAIEGMRPEDEEGGCMASGTPACLFGRSREDGKDQFWWNAPFDLSADDDIWELVTKVTKEPPFDKRELLESAIRVKINGKSIEEHHIEKLKGDIWFYKILALFFMIISLIVLFSACSPDPQVQEIRTDCHPTADRAMDKAKIGAVGKCFGWKYRQVDLTYGQCFKGAGYFATITFYCE